jgi:hypothetical protein
VQGVAATDRAKADNVSSRNWIYPFEVTRLGPRADDDYFDQSTNRYLEYQVNTGTGMQTRRINFWQYTPAKSEEPFLYFDTSRHPPTTAFDPPAATEITGLGANGDGLHVHALKKRADSPTPNMPIQFVEPERFQVLHCGNDGAWGEADFERMSYHGVQEQPSPNNDPTNPDHYLLFPNGPFTGEVADTVANFASQNKIEDAQP